jgi:hypothetical protein
MVDAERRQVGVRYCEDCGSKLDPALTDPYHPGCNLPLALRREFNEWAQRQRDEKWEAIKRNSRTT